MIRFPRLEGDFSTTVGRVPSPGALPTEGALWIADWRQDLRVDAVDFDTCASMHRIVIDFHRSSLVLLRGHTKNLSIPLDHERVGARGHGDAQLFGHHCRVPHA